MITSAKIGRPLVILWWGEVSDGREKFYSVRITLTQDGIYFSNQVRNIEGQVYAIIGNKIILQDNHELQLIKKEEAEYFTFEKKVHRLLDKRVQSLAH